MKYVISICIILVIACDSKTNESEQIDKSELLHGQWRTVRADCNIYTTFYDNDSLLLVRNQREIKGTYSFIKSNNTYTMIVTYTEDDINYANGCSNDSVDRFNFEGIVLNVKVKFTEDFNSLSFVFNGSTTTMLKQIPLE